MPNLKFLKQRRRFRANFWAYFYRTDLSIFHHLNTMSFQFATSHQAFLAFQRTLIKNDDITQELLPVESQFRMILGLLFPNCLKFIQIILPIEHFVFHAEMGILVQFRDQILPYRLFIEKQFLAAVADGSQITAGSIDIPIDITQGGNHLLDSQTLLQGIGPSAISLQAFVLFLIVGRKKIVLLLEKFGSCLTALSPYQFLELRSQYVRIINTLAIPYPVKFVQQIRTIKSWNVFFPLGKQRVNIFTRRCTIMI